jgi:hypothetical protein
VARGKAEQGQHLAEEDKSGRAKGIRPFLSLVEDGGDFFDLSGTASYKRVAPENPKEYDRQDTVSKAALSLIDLVSEEPNAVPNVHYDAMGFAPTTIRRNADSWECSPSVVDSRLDYRTFISRLIRVARLRGLLG